MIQYDQTRFFAEIRCFINVLAELMLLQQMQLKTCFGLDFSQFNQLQ